jgi:glycosyltransferase involved in cell wall biosynthesis
MSDQSTTISVITPTCNRLMGINYLIDYMDRQTVQPTEWLICNGGDHIGLSNEIHDPMPAGHKNLANNIANGLDSATGDVIVIMEDDDWYDPRHIEVCLSHLQNADATGDQTLRYYNIPHKAWRVFRSRGSALCQTAFNRSLVPIMRSAVGQAIKQGNCSIDSYFWRSVKAPTHNDETVVGIKGLSGQAGLGIGHRPDANWTRDENKLRQWIGDDALRYF